MLDSKNLDNRPLKIKRLSEGVIDQIAAGEVLERPAHMVKELLENSLDAHATKIEIYLKRGGRDVKIKDNGVGFLPEDLDIALLRHTTSKLNKVGDLWELKTFGFRGEALASISAVSHMRLSSKVKGGKAYEIQSHFGKLTSKVETEHEVGTSIEIQGLLDNVPARKKFLKTDAYEISEIKKVIAAFGLISPYIELKLFVNDKLEFIWPKASESILPRYKEILKTNDLYSFSQNFDDIKVTAYFAPPHETAKSSRKIWLFVQDRFIQDQSILAAIRDGFQNALLPGEHPIGALFIHMNPQLVDVNVHPTKSRVKFADAASIYRAVRNTLLQFVEQSPWRNDFLLSAKKPSEDFNNSSAEDPESLEVHSQSQSYKPIASPEAHSFKQTDFGLSAFRSGTLNSEIRGLQQINNQEASNPHTAKSLQDRSLTPKDFDTDINAMSSSQPSDTLSTVNKNDEPKWSNLVVVGQIAKTYIVTQNQNEMILIDQHAAHERYLFEKLWSTFKQGQPLEAQNHLLPLSYKVENEAFMELLLQEKSNLEKLSLIFEQSGPSQIEIITTPVLFKEKAIVQTLDKMLEQMLKNGSSFVFEDVLADLFATMACHSAIRAGQLMEKVEMESLLNLMDEFSTTSYCPHGRPVFVRYSFAKLETDFFRRV